ncbi:membrane protein [Pyrus ussuriensis x Pyrus communis]|uniref:Membrane protein n=2 Tax=Pyrus TaxID=3766 RepID=A0A5N5GR34_9ROSA|nr:membrane protein [Pyrus ussuriensis x Pyrus communis]
MHDFCLTIPYGLVLIGGGVFGYFRKGSTASLAGGAGIGLLLTLAGYISLKAFEGKKNSYPAFILETVCAALLTWVMGQRYMQTSKIMPAGVVAGISAVMTGFYLYKIATGGNHIPAKTKRGECLQRMRNNPTFSSMKYNCLFWKQELVGWTGKVLLKWGIQMKTYKPSSRVPQL